MQLDALVSNVIESFAEEQDENEVGGIIDHITGYKNLKNYAWVDTKWFKPHLLQTFN